MLQVLGRTSSINVRKVLWTCAEIGLTPEVVPWGSGVRDTQDPQFLALNPNGLVPVLRDGEQILWESNTICRYLAARAARHDLLPQDTSARARIEQWMDWQATELNTAWRYAFMALVRASPEHADARAALASAKAWNRCMAILDAELQRHDAFVAGSDFTLADVVLGLSTHRWYATPIERPTLAAVKRYYDRLRERPVFRSHAWLEFP